VWKLLSGIVIKRLICCKLGEHVIPRWYVNICQFAEFGTIKSAIAMKVGLWFNPKVEFQVIVQFRNQLEFTDWFGCKLVYA
jgi:hypothetical protein